MSNKKERVYKSQIGSIPKIVNNFKPKTDNQKIFHQKICNFDNQLILCHGIAGTGKTYVSIYKALQDVLRRGTPYEKLIIINPTVDVGNEDKLGFLPGELSAKIQQYNESTFTILDKIIGKTRAGKMIQDNKIEIGVLNFLRGNITKSTDGTLMIIQGDMSQCDKYKTNGVTNYEKSGFYDVWFRLQGVKGVEHMAFSRDDCIRHPLVKRILKTYEDEHEIDLVDKSS